MTIETVEDQRRASTADHAGDERSRCRAFVAAGLNVGLVGSGVVGVAESLAAAKMNAGYVQAGAWPIELVVASAGRAIITHALLWCPVMIVAAVVYWAAVRRRPPRRPTPLLAALFVLVAGAVIAPLDLDMAGLTAAIVYVAAEVGVVIAALATFALWRRWSRRRRSRKPAWIVNVTATVIGLIALVVFVRSAQFDPATFRVRAGQHQPRTTEQPNVLWIVWDTTRADHMACHRYDRPTTPFLDKLAKSALVFDRCLSNAIWTAPAHASMFTGLSVRQHGVDFGHIWLDDRFTTVAESFRDAGYVTASFGNNPWLWRHTNLLQGFDHVFALNYLRQMTRFSLLHLVQELGVRPPLPWLDPDFGAAITNDMIAAWLDRNLSPDRPVFLFVNYMEAHLPYSVPQSYRADFLDARQVSRSYRLRSLFGNIVEALDMRFNIQGPDFVTPSDREIVRRQYDAALRYLDDRTSELVRVFDERGLLDNTIVIVTGDHGEYLDSHGMWGHGFMTYSDLAHVPLLLRPPRLDHGARIDTPVQLSDLYFTLLRQLQPARADSAIASGPDLVVIGQAGGAQRLAITEYNGPSDQKRNLIKRVGKSPRLQHMSAPQLAIEDGRFKLMRSSDGTRELYDVRADSAETNDLYEQLPAEARRLDAALDQWLATVQPYQPGEGQVPTIDPETLRALRSLGYLVDVNTNR